jgi:hypothetical protein
MSFTVFITSLLKHPDNHVIKVNKNEIEIFGALPGLVFSDWQIIGANNMQGNVHVFVYQILAGYLFSFLAFRVQWPFRFNVKVPKQLTK